MVIKCQELKSLISSLPQVSYPKEREKEREGRKERARARERP